MSLETGMACKKILRTHRKPTYILLSSGEPACVAHHRSPIIERLSEIFDLDSSPDLCFDMTGGTGIIL